MNESKYHSHKFNMVILPVIAAAGFLPLIVHMYHYDAGWESLAWFPNISNSQIDFFLGWKSIGVIILTIIMAGVLFHRYKKNEKNLLTEPAFLLLLIYGIFVLMSAIMSPYKPQVFTGSYEVLQPAEVLLGYLVICFYTYQFSNQENQLLCILQFSGIGLGIMLIIGFFQFIGFDLLQTTVGKALLASPSWWDKLDQITFSFPKHQVYTTLYNPDFLSFYFGLVIPILVAMFFASKRTIHKLILCIMIILSVICVIGSGASSAYLAVAITAIAGAYLYLSRKKKTWITGNIVALISVIIVAGICMTTSLGTHVKALFVGTQRTAEEFALKSIETTDEGIKLNIDGKILTISYIFDAESETATVFFTDDQGNFLSSEIIATASGSAYSLTAEDYAACQVEPVYLDNTLCIKVSLEETDWYFTNQTDGTYYYCNPIGEFEKVAPIKKSTLFRDDAMSGRGNLWNLIIPKLPSHILIGGGANSFARVFPQTDYVYKVYNGLGNVFAVKAHNWFLQEWVENGLIGTLCLFAFYLWYFIKSVRIYHSCSLNSATSRIGFGIFIGTIGYMAAGVVNDANVTTAPVFWVAMGLGMAANRMIAEKNEK